MGSSVGRVLMAAAFMILEAKSAEAQSVMLQIRPRVGDTLHVRLEQEVEMTGMPQGCGGQQNGLRARAKTVPANCGDIRTMTTRMEVYSRAIARRATHDATDMLAITDSVLTSTEKRGPLRRATNQPMQRAPVEIRIASDGEVEVGAGPASDEMRTLLGQMPATLSRKAVAVGEKWIHEMRVPLAREPGATGLVRTTFQLDSVRRNGDIAYISMRGTLSHEHANGSDSETSGSLAGSMRFDRRRGWITDTHATIDVWSEVAASASRKAMDVHTMVVQSLHVSSDR
jgi:hypothetical protein